jgi:hypothetical protein
MDPGPATAATVRVANVALITRDRRVLGYADRGNLNAIAP